MRIQKESANAKINLYLDVVALREDGFHDIKSVMHTVSLCDDITVKYTPAKESSIKLKISGSKFLPTDGKNLAYRAAALFLERAGLTAGIEITINKVIPIAAGLAGGSADAAAVLRAMNKIFSRMFSEKGILSMGAELGSDVPYCILRKTALCEGRGELMTELNTKLSSHFVIAVPDDFVSTPMAYRRLDELYSSFDGSVSVPGEGKYERFSADIAEGKITDDGIFNIFEYAVFEMCPAAQRIKEKMYSLGAVCAMMSGSGPSVFGSFETEELARCACSKLSEEGISAFYAVSFN